MRIDDYMRETFIGFIIDPPDSQFQRGYLSALMEICREFVPTISRRELDEMTELLEYTGGN